MKNIGYIGDVHGNFNHIIWWLKQGHHKKITLIQVGDFGIGFKPVAEDLVLKLLNQELEKRESLLLVIRGNHDNPDYFDGNHDYEFIKFLPDYTEMEIDGLNHLFIGGAVSIDRCLRVKNVDYWENEKFICDLEKVKSMKNIDIVVTHSAPDFNLPIGLNGIVYGYAQKDSDLLGDIEKERSSLSDIFNEIRKKSNPQLHFYGHFHNSKSETINDCRHIMLDINEVYVPHF